MRRSPALVRLSREHHQGLEAALALRRAAGSGEQARNRFVAFWEPDGQEHFALEEAVLLPAMEDLGPEAAAACARVRTEHDSIRRLAAKDDPSIDDLHALGAKLHDHIRFEERELFPLAERLLGDDGLSALAL